MRGFVWIATIAVAATAPARAHESPPRYTIATTLTDDGQPIAKPILTVEQGKATRVEIADQPGRRYLMTLTPRPLADGRVSLDMRVDATSPTSGKIDATPVLEMAPGATAVIELGDRRPDRAPFRVELQVTRAD